MVSVAEEPGGSLRFRSNFSRNGRTVMFITSLLFLKSVRKTMKTLWGSKPQGIEEGDGLGKVLDGTLLCFKRKIRASTHINIILQQAHPNGKPFCYLVLLLLPSPSQHSNHLLDPPDSLLS